MKFSLLEKLKMCFTILTLRYNYSWDEKDDKGFIFSQGYRSGLLDKKISGMLKVVISVYASNKEYEYFFDNLNDAVKAISNFNENERNDGDSVELFQTHLDRDLEHLVPVW